LTWGIEFCNFELDFDPGTGFGPIEIEERNKLLRGFKAWGNIAGLSILLLLNTGSRPRGQTAEDFIKAGDSLYSLNNYNESIERYRSACLLDSNSFEAFWKLGRSLNLKGETAEKDSQLVIFEESRDAETRALALNEGDADAHFQLARALGKIALFKGVFKSASLAKQVRKECLRALEIDSLHDGAWHVLGRWHREVSKKPKILRIPMGLGAASKDDALAFMQKALEINPKIPEMHNSIALALLGLGKQKEAIEELKKDIQISPRSAFNYFMLGQVYLQLKDYNNARKSYEKAIKLQPDYTNAYHGLFTVCNRLKEKTKAREYMAIFRKLKAQDMKDLKDRNEVFDDLVNMRKGAAETFMQVGQMYQIKGDFYKAEELLERAMTLDTENTIYIKKLASLYQINIRFSDALKLYKKIIETEPQDLFCYLNIGILSIHLKKAGDAEAAFLKAISIAPKNSMGYRELAQLYLRAGVKLTKARELAEKAVELEANAVNYFVLSWACDKNGDPASGLKAIEQAIKLESNNIRYKNVYEHIKKRVNR